MNYFDPDGRFSSVVYKQVKPIVLGAFQPLKGLYGRSVQSFNSVPAFFANHGMTRSGSYEVGYFDLPRGAIGLINGINNLKAESIAIANQWSRYAGGAKIHGIYNATNWDTNRMASTGIDILECGLQHIGIHTPTVQLLKNQWAHFIATHGPDEKFLQGSHSGGALQVYHALLSSSESVRKRIISLAIAPAVIIPKELCFASYNYISRRDFVTHLDLIGKMKYGNELQILEPHPDAKLWDHDALSPTFEIPLQEHISDYIKNYGGKK